MSKRLEKFKAMEYCLNKNTQDDPSEVSGLDKNELVEMLDAMVKRLEGLPNHVKDQIVTNRDLYGFMSLICLILKEFHKY